MIQVNTRTHWVLSKRNTRRWTVGGLLLIGLFLLVAVLVHQAWLTPLGEFLIINEEPRPADAIVVVSQGQDDRPIFASKLYVAGYAPLVITLGGVTSASGAGTTGAARDAEILYYWGVPTENIAMLDGTANLREEAFHSRDVLLARGARTALVVSDPIHMRRVALVFGPLYREVGLTFIPIANAARGFNTDGWWRRKTDAVVVGIEYLKMGLDLTW